MKIPGIKKEDNSNDGLRYANIGFEFAGSVGFFALIGYFVGQHWGRAPAGVLVGSLTGLVVGFYLLIKEVLMMNRSNDRKTRDGSGKSNNSSE